MAGKMVHFELPAADTARAKGFWSGVFGWEFGDSAMPEGEYYMVRTGEDQGGAVMTATIVAMAAVQRGRWATAGDRPCVTSPLVRGSVSRPCRGW